MGLGDMTGQVVQVAEDSAEERNKGMLIKFSEED